MTLDYLVIFIMGVLAEGHSDRTKLSIYVVVIMFIWPEYVYSDIKFV
jgi:hypothetical protein